GENAQNDILENVDLNWSRINLPKINSEIDKIISGYNYKNSANTLTQILALKNNLEKEKNSINNEYYLQLIDYKIKEINHVAIQLSGLFAEATTSIQNYSVGDSLAIKLSANMRQAKGFNSEIEIHVLTSKE